MKTNKGLLVVGAGVPRGVPSPAVCQGRFRGMRHATQRRQAATTVDSDEAEGGELTALPAMHAGRRRYRADRSIETRIGPIEAFVFNIGANVPCSILEKPRQVFQDLGNGLFLRLPQCTRRWPRMGHANRGTSWFTGATPACAALRIWPRRRAKHGLRAFGAKHGPRTWTTEHPRRSCSGRRRHRYRLHPQSFPPRNTRPSMRTAFSTLNTSPKTTGICTATTDAGRSSWICARGTNAGIFHNKKSSEHEQNRRVLFRSRQSRHLPGLHQLPKICADTDSQLVTFQCCSAAFSKPPVMPHRR